MMKMVAPVKTPEDIDNFVKNSDCRVFYVYHHRFCNNNFEYVNKYIEHAHLNDAKIYINFKHNILEDDIETVKKFILYLLNTKIDGIFVNSYAILEFIKDHKLPYSVIIDSYFDIHNLSGVEFVSKYNKISSIIITEEIYLKNIEKIKKYAKIPVAIDSDNLPSFCENIERSRVVDFVIIKGKFASSEEILKGIKLVQNIIHDPKNYLGQELPFRHVRKCKYRTDHFSGRVLSASGKDFKFSKNIQSFNWELSGTKLKRKINYSNLNIPRINLRLSSLEQIKELKNFIKKAGFNPIYSIEYGEVASTADLYKDSFDQIVKKVKKFADKYGIKLNLSTPRILIERDFDRVYESIKNLVLSEPKPSTLVVNNIGFWYSAVNDPDYMQTPIEIGCGINLGNSKAIESLNNFHPIEAVDFSSFQNIDNIINTVKNVTNIIATRKLLIAGCVRVESMGLCPLNTDSALVSRLSCPAPCHKGHYALKDPTINKVFPFVVDGFCRMHMFEQGICEYFKEIPYLQSVGINEFIIDFSAVHSPLLPKILTNFLNNIYELCPLHIEADLCKK